MSLTLRSRDALRPRLRLLGPAFAVSIGYIDPGNWAADFAASIYHFSLLWVVLGANVIAVIVQLAVTRVTVVTGEDLATLISARWSKAKLPLCFAFEGAIIATDLAEFTGITLGAQLLFHLTTAMSVAVGVAVVLLLLCFGQKRLRLFDVAMIGVLGFVAVAFCSLIQVTHPDAVAVTHGALIPVIPNREALLVIVAIIGATVMPHNLFLHSSLIKGRIDQTPLRERGGIGRFYVCETMVALTVAAFVNGAILVVGASMHRAPAGIAEAFAQLSSIGGIDSSAIFGAALLLSGIAASTTATLTGDVIFGAFAPARIPFAARRIVTVLPAAALLLFGVDGASLLIWSQTALCFVLPVALVPLLALLHRVERPTIGGGGFPSFFAASACAGALCAVLDVALLWQTL